LSLKCVYDYSKHAVLSTLKRIVLTFIILFFPVQVFATGHQITQWADNRAGAVSITFDDGLSSQYSLAIPALNEKGFKGSFFIITDITTNTRSNGYASWEQWRDAANQGHEIGSHTLSHPHLPQLSLPEMEEEIGESKTIIDDQITTQECLTFVYPFGDYNSNAKAYTKKYYIAARGVWCGFNKAPYDFYALRGCGDSDSLEQMKLYTDEAEQHGYWLITIHHSLDGTGYGVWTIDTFISYLEYLQTKDLWVDTFGSVAKYIKERESATLSLVSNSENQIVLSLTDTLDDSIFDQPLTIRSEVPSNWTNILVQQGGGSIIVKPVVEGTQTVVYYNALPDRGIIILQEHTANQPAITGLSPTSATAGGPSFTLTVNGNNFVNGSTVRWNNSDRFTTFFSENQIKASIRAADISVAGITSVTVRNPSGDISNIMGFEVKNVLATLTVQKTGPGLGTVTAPGISCGNDCTESYIYGTTVVLTASPGTGSSLSGWIGCDSINDNTCSITLTNNKTVSAFFALEQHTLTVTQAGSGSGTLMASGLNCSEHICTGIYSYGDTVQISAVPAMQSVLGEWTGCDSVNDNVCTVVIDRDRDITVTFYSECILTVDSQGDGSGKVTINPPGIDCEKISCSNVFIAGTPIRLTASPYDGSVFSFWSGGCTGTTETCDLTIKKDTKITAHFVPYETKRYNLNIQRIKKNQGEGIVKSTDGNINCGHTCFYSYYKDTIVTLSAEANERSTFLGWRTESPTCAGTDICIVTIDKAKTVKAIFVGHYTLKVAHRTTKKGTGTVTSTPAGINCRTGSKEGCAFPFGYNEVVMLSASADTGSTFLGWYPSRLCQGTNVCTVPMNKKRSVKALFSGK